LFQNSTTNPGGQFVGLAQLRDAEEENQRHVLILAHDFVKENHVHVAEGQDDQLKKEERKTEQLREQERMKGATRRRGERYQSSEGAILFRAIESNGKEDVRELVGQPQTDHDKAFHSGRVVVQSVERKNRRQVVERFEGKPKWKENQKPKTYSIGVV
jgi:hypothetical protein